MTKKKVWKHKYKDFMDAIKNTGEPLLDDGEDEYDQEMMEKDYKPFIIQKSLVRSKFINEDNIHLLNMINRKDMMHGLNKKPLFVFLRLTLSKNNHKKK